MYTTGVKIQGSVTVAQTEPKKSGIKMQGSGGCCIVGAYCGRQALKYRGLGPDE